MERFKKYEEIILQFYKDFITNHKNDKDPLSYEIIVDREKKIYILVLVGWEDTYTFTYSVLFHLEITNDKVRLSRNITEMLVMEELEKRGIPKKDMWITFKPDYANHYAGFSVEKELVES